MTRIAAATAAAPAMSDFIVTMPVAGLMHRPPESNVMPLPTKARCGVRRWRGPACSVMVTIRGGWTEPWPTPMMPPHPALARAFSSITATLTVLPAARALTDSAKLWGKRTFGAVLTRSRV